jgi:hypothetical protein
MLKSLLILGISLATPVAEAKEVCRHVDEAGRITYTDVPPGQKCEAVKMRAPVNPSTYDYESARMRADSERMYHDRMQYEQHQRPPIVTHDPQRLQTPPPRAPRSPGVTVRRDPNLPDVPAPSSERIYHYDGR